ncbi:hypothetical protein P43SY_004523 [Pythium insidiosum]|uniref:Transmembrane protein n=1 Tax=Pythium insidiosum TaxID=114742 RepID=A0AAD5L7G0_PYTIN|nr:hypothetical protein P43SY_004523 [Pythium insidiosum]
MMATRMSISGAKRQLFMASTLSRSTARAPISRSTAVRCKSGSPNAPQPATASKDGITTTTKMLAGYITFGLAAMAMIARHKERNESTEESARIFNFAKRAVSKDRRFFEAVGYPKDFERIESEDADVAADPFSGTFRVIGDKATAIVTYQHQDPSSPSAEGENESKGDGPLFDELIVRLEDGSEFSALETFVQTEGVAQQQKAASLGKKLAMPVIGGVLIGGFCSFLVLRIVRNRPFYVHKLALDRVNNNDVARVYLGHPIKSNRKEYVGSLTDTAANYSIACKGPKGEGTLIVKAFKATPESDAADASSGADSSLLSTPGTDWKFSTLVLSIKRNELRKEKDKTAKPMEIAFSLDAGSFSSDLFDAPAIGGSQLLSPDVLTRNAFVICFENVLVPMKWMTQNMGLRPSMKGVQEAKERAVRNPYLQQSLARIEHVAIQLITTIAAHGPVCILSEESARFVEIVSQTFFPRLAYCLATPQMLPNVQVIGAPKKFVSSAEKAAWRVNLMQSLVRDRLFAGSPHLLMSMATGRFGLVVASPHHVDVVACSKALEVAPFVIPKSVRLDNARHLPLEQFSVHLQTLMQYLQEATPFALLATASLTSTATAATASGRAFRHEDLHRAKLAHALARREMMMRQAQERQQRAMNQTDGNSSLLDATGQAIRATFSTLHGFMKGLLNTTARHDKIKAPGSTEAAIQSAEAQVEAALGARPAAPTCILGVCGLNLVFAIIWVAFSVCFAIVYIMDKQRRRKSPRPKIQEAEQQDIHEHSTYYQEVTGAASSMTLRRRPSKVVQ